VGVRAAEGGAGASPYFSKIPGKIPMYIQRPRGPDNNKTIDIMTAINAMAGLDFTNLVNSIKERIVAGTPGIRLSKEMVIDYVEHRDFAEMVKDLAGIDLYSLWSDTGEKAEMINLIHDSFIDFLH